MFPEGSPKKLTGPCVPEICVKNSLWKAVESAQKFHPKRSLHLACCLVVCHVIWLGSRSRIQVNVLKDMRLPWFFRDVSEISTTETAFPLCDFTNIWPIIEMLQPEGAFYALENILNDSSISIDKCPREGLASANIWRHSHTNCTGQLQTSIEGVGAFPVSVSNVNGRKSQLCVHFRKVFCL